MPRVLLLAEFLIIYVALPLVYRYSRLRAAGFPILWVISSYAFWQLFHDPHFDRSRLLNAGTLPGQLVSIVVPFAVCALLIWMGVRRFAPASEWNFVRKRPALWAFVMFAYPVLSVYPQGLLYRAFFFERYAPLFPGRWTLFLASALVFSLLHVVYRNPLAPALTFAGGVLFAWRYLETGSLVTSSFEHALYGCWLFTVGLGQYFYHGTIPARLEAARR